MNNLLNYLANIKNFSGSVLVAKEGEVIFKDGFGFSDRAKTMKNTSRTNYGIASITKSFTALSIMQLVQKNLVRIEDRVIDYLPNIYPDQPITIHQLLCQTSGIPNYVFDKQMQTGEEFTPNQIIEYVIQKPIKFQPGKKWLYSNTNYVLLAKIIEEASGQSYQEYVTEHIFKPVGMVNTYFDGMKNEEKAEYGGGVFDCKPSLLFGAGDIDSNVNDLFLYDQALYTDALATKLSLKQMEEKYHNGFFIQYGYGWFVKNNFGQRSICHGGFHPNGYTSHLERFLDDKMTIIVLSNNLKKYSRLGIKYFNSTDLAREIAAVAFGRTVFPWQKIY